MNSIPELGVGAKQLLFAVVPWRRFNGKLRKSQMAVRRGGRLVVVGSVEEERNRRLRRRTFRSWKRSRRTGGTPKKRTLSRAP